jgi:hypothetical protein
MRRLRRIARRAVDFATLVAIPFLVVVGVGDLLAGDLETGGVEIAVVVIAALTAWNSRSRAKASLTTHVTGVRPWEALVGFFLFALVGAVSITNAVRDEGARATTDTFGAVLLFALAAVALWVLWRSRAGRSGSVSRSRRS